MNYLEPKVNGIQSNVIEVNLKSHHLVLRPVVAPHCGNTMTRSFTSMVHAVRAVAAVNGTFFDGGSLRTIGSLVLDGKMVYEGYIGNAIAIDKDGNARFLKVNHVNGRHVDWSPYVFAVSTGPTLIYQSKLALNPWSEGFRDPDVYAEASRTAIGVTRDRRLMFVTVHRHITLSQLAGVMKGLGAEYALNLDGGSSSAMYWNGSVITNPSRRLTNILTICPAVDPPPVARIRHKDEPVDLAIPLFDGFINDLRLILP